MKTNKALGNEFEEWLCDYGYNLGFFAHRLTQSSSGQPADIVFARANIAMFVDAKVCSGVAFPIKRVEENQRNAFTLLNEVGCRHTYFAFRFEVNDGYDYRYLSLKEIDKLSESMKTISYNLCHPLEEMFGNVIIEGMCRR